MTATVCAVLVTYNRRELLRESLCALQGQSVALDKIVVFENASTDGTREMLAQEFPDVLVIVSAENVGGAGGFHEGIKWAADNGYDWLWIMDDDSVPEPDALAKLLAAVKPSEADAPMVLSSRVVWTDGDVHPMNRPQFRLDGDMDVFAGEVAGGRVPIRSASFVSVLINRVAVQRHGLPFADYFIWNDDVEYTARILRKGSGYWIPSSVVVHKTLKKRVQRGDVRVERRYYSLRNRLWMMLYSEAWGGRERIAIMPSIPKIIYNLFREAGFNRVAALVAYKGLRDGVFKRPRR